MEQSRIQIFIPTLNNAADLDATLESIRAQDYNEKDIYISAMDFGSTDGTYEKLLRYGGDRFGVYRDGTTQNRRLMLSRMAALQRYTNPGGRYCFKVVLYPGDVLYPRYLSVCSELFIRRQDIKPQTVFCEADYWDEDHTVVSQPPLFAEDRVIDGCHELCEYVRRGYRHQIQCMTYGLGERQVRFSGEQNEQRWWNKCAAQNNEQFALYIREPLICQKRVSYENELEEILLRWESVIATRRGYEARAGKALDRDFEALATRNLAEYALWRSWLLGQRAGADSPKAAEDCFLIAGAIAPDIMEGELYLFMRRFIMERDGSAAAYLEEYFSTHGMN